MFQKKGVEKTKRNFVFSKFFCSRKSCRLWDNVEKYCWAGQATDENMAHAHCMLDAYGYKHTHTLRLCNTHSFSTTTMVARTRFNVTLYVYWLSCCFLWGLFYLRTVCSDTHMHTSYSVGLLWTGDQIVAKTCTLTIQNNHKPKTSTMPEGFEPAIAASEQRQTHNLGRAATGVTPHGIHN